VPVWMMWALKVSRSTTAAASLGSVKVAPHSLKGAQAMDTLFACGDDLEQEFGAAGVEVDVAEFVDRVPPS